MIVLITGGSGSGKSAYAEKAAVSLAGKGPLYYLATMKVSDGEGRKRVDRHRGLRAGKGFLTIEQPAGILQAVPRMNRGKGTVLLECLSNLAANEMFDSKEVRREQEVADRLCAELCFLAEHMEHLMIVTNNVFEDGISYEETTRAYMEALGRVNAFLAARADTVTEVVVGIPVSIKGKLV
ncbi:bifunctional adenosylcobinamide kinase/adenosylcobinamide-phosphate guanylyltransferase [Caproiciproducens sp. CPB-2]|uniref:bifunctional adenosylcobinamide kinase/adenosylcobinamide-phosphate guanylyltransferase n=1 Tax=Caproiciproducens sp. CPB-2 TaxID=3030017 RepID=UPI0023DA1455|nr:bifunctional adenosylcobinamide kinase/adenosylcobinamide-phosphate guanylyltransferase [Caproiciproducens sp. CPB-2]MDF1495629.1 bifunctional adenosylcobinamide kinase/adenosylcobinamide-phosphate guanylyltransferase [Caproiciproducens sp. CPB-2]